MNELVKEEEKIPESSDRASEVQLVIFHLAKEQYGLPITKVQDINRIMPITKMPSVPEFVEGIINLRGRIIPVVDLRKRFYLPSVEYTDEARIIIVQIRNELVGIIVDSVTEVARISSKDVEPPPATFSNDVEMKYILGVGKRADSLITLLDIDQIMTAKEASELRQVL
jgi:purine-binding chemotaxis protein CheW